jgi:hypothetical protein
MGDILESLDQESQKSDNIMSLGWVVTNDIRAITQPNIVERAQAMRVTSMHSLGR